MTEPKQILAKPERPLDNECCGGGACQPCVWDHYFEQLELWQKQQEQLAKNGDEGDLQGN